MPPPVGAPPLDGVAASTDDGVVAAKHEWRVQRRFVRMLILEGGSAPVVVITPPEQGAVAPNVVRVPEAPPEAAIVDVRPWEALAEWLLSGGRLSACSIAAATFSGGIPRSAVALTTSR